jgi:ParB-like chromosome segregation protein Spo0J
MVCVSSSFTRIANSEASGERARHVKRNGKRQPVHHYEHQLGQAMLISDTSLTLVRIRQVPKLDRSYVKSSSSLVTPPSGFGL